MKSYDVTEDGVKRIYDVWVVDIPAIKGKMIRKTPDRVRLSIVALPEDVLKDNKIVTLDVYIFTPTNFLSSSA